MRMACRQRRLGALYVFTPYVPDFRWELRLTFKDERKVINLLVKMGCGAVLCGASCGSSMMTVIGINVVYVV